MKVHFKKEALEKGIRPKKIFSASQTPLHLKPAADKVLAEAIKSKLIEEVPRLVHGKKFIVPGGPIHSVFFISNWLLN